MAIFITDNKQWKRQFLVEKKNAARLEESLHRAKAESQKIQILLERKRGTRLRSKFISQEASLLILMCSNTVITFLG